jgi:hypothetical protein
MESEATGIIIGEQNEIQSPIASLHQLLSVVVTRDDGLIVRHVVSQRDLPIAGQCPVSIHPRRIVPPESKPFLLLSNADRPLILSGIASLYLVLSKNCEPWSIPLIG